VKNACNREKFNKRLQKTGVKNIISKAALNCSALRTPSSFPRSFPGPLFQ